ncbi:MAG TPA: acyltransferase [Nevskia sp.]|nr:acyltransferase [Nevskia sp.]
MSEKTSLRLDLMRWIAAGMVFVCHYSFLGYTGQPETALMEMSRPWGLLGVAVFFVLSGYVIAYVAEAKHPDFRDYLRARLARLYSVYIPAMIITLLLDLAGRACAASLYAGYPGIKFDTTVAKSIIFLIFFQENSLLSLRWMSNGPMWSLAYEFWYYIIFGVAYYFKSRLRAVMLPAVLLLAGWKILILMPIWLSGVLLYRFRQRFSGMSARSRLGLGLASATIIISLATPSVFQWIEPWVSVGFRRMPPGFHAWFLFYYLALPALFGLVASCIGEGSYRRNGVTRLIRWAAGFSFSLYLLHVPLIIFFRALGVYDTGSLLQVLLFSVVILAVIFGISLFTEKRKDLWSRWISRWV